LNDERRYHEVAKIFRTWIDRLEEGWLHVIPYNQSLIFLRDRHGAYDFLVPGFRDEAFDHQIFGNYLHYKDIPKSNDVYHFRRWLYFEYSGWLEQDEHCSETAYYANLKEPMDYPGPEVILRDYFLRSGKYESPRATATAVDGYYAVRLSGRLLCVSNLITIRQFKDFMDHNPEYAKYSREPERVDRWETVNSDEDQSLPASVTWYDANAYAAWISKTRGLPVRLLYQDEYLGIVHSTLGHPGTILEQDFLNMGHRRLCRFFLPDGTPLEGHPPYMEEEQFQNLHFRFIRDAMNWKTTSSGLKFLVSQHFGEWLNGEAVAVNSLTLSSLCYADIPPLTGRFCAASTGKYKSKKVGFRLCYLGEPH